MASKGGGEADTWSTPLLSTELRGGHRDAEARGGGIQLVTPTRVGQLGEQMRTLNVVSDRKQAH